MQIMGSLLYQVRSSFWSDDLGPDLEGCGMCKVHGAMLFRSRHDLTDVPVS